MTIRKKRSVNKVKRTRTRSQKKIQRSPQRTRRSFLNKKKRKTQKITKRKITKRKRTKRKRTKRKRILRGGSAEAKINPVEMGGGRRGASRARWARLTPSASDAGQQLVPEFIRDISLKSGISVRDILGEIDGIQKALRVAEIKELSPPKKIEEVYDENGPLMYTVVEFNNKLFAAYEGEPDVFLTGVKYTDKVKWFKFSEIYDKAKSSLLMWDHHKTRDAMISAAKENTLNAWNRRGIPPLLLLGDESNFTIRLTDGQHRVNSVESAAKILNKPHEEMGIPVTFEDNNEWREPGPVYYSVNKSIFDEPDLLKLKKHFSLHALDTDDPRVV